MCIIEVGLQHITIICSTLSLKFSGHMNGSYGSYDALYVNVQTLPVRSILLLEQPASCSDTDSILLYGKHWFTSSRKVANGCNSYHFGLRAIGNENKLGWLWADRFLGRYSGLIWTRRFVRIVTIQYLRKRCVRAATSTWEWISLTWRQLADRVTLTKERTVRCKALQKPVSDLLWTNALNSPFIDKKLQALTSAMGSDALTPTDNRVGSYEALL